MALIRNALGDYAHRQTDREIEEIEKRLHKEYAKAVREVRGTFDEYMRKFAVKDAIKKQQVADGTLSEGKYNEWRHGQMCIGQRWKDLKNQLAQDLVNTNSIARSVVVEHMPEVYALNHNYATFQVEKDSMIDTSYTLYNRRTVENLVKDDRNLLPRLDENGPTARKLREHKDMVWNREKIHSVIVQGVLQGMSNQQIADRLERIVGMNEVASIRNARTMMTGVENKARQDAYDSLKRQGLKLREMWVATLDSRTRGSHRWLHGSYKDEKSGEYDNGCRYPGDPAGDAEEVYNCRCCEVAEFEGYEFDVPEYSPGLKGMTYNEWLGAHR